MVKPAAAADQSVNEIAVQNRVRDEPGHEQDAAGAAKKGPPAVSPSPGRGNRAACLYRDVILGLGHQARPPDRLRRSC